MDTGTRSFRSAFRNGSWSDWPLAMVSISLFFLALSCRSRIIRRLKNLSVPGLLGRKGRRPHDPSLASPRRDSSHPKPFGNARGDTFRRCRIGSVEPLGPGLGPEPGELPARKLARGGHGLLHRFRERRAALEVLPELPVADEPDRSEAGVQVPARAKPLDLPDEALLHHRVEAPRNALEEQLAVRRGEHEREVVCAPRPAQILG